MYGLLKSHLTISISDRIVVSNDNGSGNDKDAFYFAWDDKHHEIDVV